MQCVSVCGLVVAYSRNLLDSSALTVGVLTRGGGLLSRFFDCRSKRSDGATVVGGAGVAIGTSVPSCRMESYTGYVKVRKFSIIQLRAERELESERARVRETCIVEIHVFPSVG